MIIYLRSLIQVFLPAISNFNITSLEWFIGKLFRRYPALQYAHRVYLFTREPHMAAILHPIVIMMLLSPIFYEDFVRPQGYSCKLFPSVPVGSSSE